MQNKHTPLMEELDICMIFPFLYIKVSLAFMQITIYMAIPLKSGLVVRPRYLASCYYLSE